MAAQTLLCFSHPNGSHYGWMDFEALSTVSDDVLDQLHTESLIAQSVFQAEACRRKREPTNKKFIERFYRTRRDASSVDQQVFSQNGEKIASLVSRYGGTPQASVYNRLKYADAAKVIRLTLTWPHPIHASLTPEPPKLPPKLAAAHPVLLSPVARMIYFLGNSMPSCFFADTTTVWSEDGEVRIVRRDIEQWKHDLSRLLSFGLVKEDENGLYSLGETEASEMSRHIPLLDASRRQQALEHMMFVFPKDGGREPFLYTQKGTALLPILWKLLPSLWEGPQKCDNVHFLELALEALLSASQFGAYVFKAQAIQAAEEVALLLDDPVSLFRVKFRHLDLKRLYERNSGPWIFPPVEQLVPDCKRSNAFRGRLILSKTQVMLKDNPSSASILEILEQFQPLDPAHVSSHERYVRLECRLMYGQILRHEGRFQDAVQVLKMAHGDAVECSYRNGTKIGCEYYDTLCEAGQPDKALAFVRADVHLARVHLNLEDGYGRRMVLSKASAYLMSALFLLRATRQVDKNKLDRAKELFEWLGRVYGNMQRPSDTMQRRLLAVQSGLAIISHVQSHWPDAVSLWGQAKATAIQLYPQRGWAFMVTSYSHSQAAYQLGDCQASTWYDEAVCVWEQLGRRRQYHFIALGSVWPDLAGDWEEETYGKRLIALSDDCI